MKKEIKIDFEKLYKKAGKAIKKIDKDSYYIKTYEVFVKKQPLNENIFLMKLGFVNSWMPTILNDVNLKSISNIIENIKSGKIEKVTKDINNSMVGVSKLLHFIYPDKYAIWDKRVGNYLGIGSYILKQPKRYEEYISKLEIITETEKERIKVIQGWIKDQIGYDVTPMRAIELVMFELGRKK